MSKIFHIVLLACLCLNVSRIQAQDVIVHHNDYDVTLTAKHKLKVTRIISKTIIKDPKGYNGNIQIPFRKGIDIKHISGSIRDANKVLIKELDKKDFETYSTTASYSLIDDGQVLYYNHSYPQLPVTINLRYEYESDNSVYLPDWYPISDSNTKLEHSSYKLESEIAINHKILNFEKWDLTQDPNKLEFKCENVGPIKNEIYTPHKRSIYPKVFFMPSKFKWDNKIIDSNNWQKYGEWFYNEFGEGNEVSDDDQKMIQRLKAASSSKLELAKSIYKFVQDNTRYVSIQEGVGGIIPTNSKEVSKLKYGDCKGLTNYTKVLLELAGINSNYTEIYADADAPFSYYSDFCNLTQGNHIILNIPIESDTFWVDCTSNTAPFGYLGKFTANRTGLVINSTGGTLTKTPDYNPHNNYVSTIIYGQNNIQIEHQYSGLELDGRLSMKDYKEAYKKYIKKSLQEKMDVGELTDIEHDYDENTGTLTETYANQQAKIFKSIAGMKVLSLNLFDYDIPSQVDTASRTQPIFIPYQKNYTLNYKVDIPDQYQLSKQPNDIDFSNDFGSIKSTTTIDDKQVLVNINFTLNHGTYNKTSISKLYDLFQNIRPYADFKLYFSKTN